MIRGAMRYPGGKFKSLPFILPELPYRKMYIEPFGGSGVVLLNRKVSNLEVYNDRHSGIVAFYTMLRERPEDLIARLELMPHSREEWERCRATWEAPSLTMLDKAVRWYYCCAYSFVGKSKAFGRITSPGTNIAGSIQNRLPDFWQIHLRLRNVQLENLSWEEIIKDYDHSQAVFYMDPPYINCHGGMYDFNMSENEHIKLLDAIMDMSAFVAVSGFPSDLYDSYDWDKRIEWDRRDMANGMAVSINNNREEYGERKIVKEVLWIKE